MSDEYRVSWSMNGIECEVAAPNAAEALGMYHEIADDEKRTNAKIIEPGESKGYTEVTDD